ncbi:ZYBA0S06-04478g1_1 [Zygosaccharomyces bailii CLIB 213]|uniref:ZYBA0S06-04478g1_1 n=1 Tax=Zygosaccharomyces bailii (strain CLIB 213 / ATCC 58445 / CBS 680 / BCRC 21525 / NBRC 1098 / NCYC 1416 / NRRL Y-2227) TaxID=1333698 RepID=A0A8J2T7S7_ZYGB2|nr:ZYBA0S06-04478g1_1 [Zygosaccharomyces bailii CLIB 213]
MSDKKPDNSLSNIPEVIDPGITIPIFEEDVGAGSGSSTTTQVDQQQPQKLGSYRARAGKFSNTLSNLLPTISAKLHHSKKQQQQVNTQAGKPIECDTPSNASSDSTVGSKNVQTTPSKQKNFLPSLDSTTVDGVGSLTPPKDLEKLVHFPDSNYYMGTGQGAGTGIAPSRTSNDSFTFGSSLPRQISRTRNNTITSQVTSMSSLQPNPASTSVIWSTNPNTSPGEQPVQQSFYPQFGDETPLTTNPQTSPLNEYSTNTAYFDTLMASGTGVNSGTQLAIPPGSSGGQSMNRTTSNNNNSITGNHNRNNSINGHNNNISNNNINQNTFNSISNSGSTKSAKKLTVPNMWSNNQTLNRPRSHSNASSIYTDAPLYEQTSRSRATSAYTVSQPQPQDIPLVADDIDSRSINWVSTDIMVPPINQISNLLPTNTISISNVFSLQQQQPQLMNTVNLTSASLATLCSKYGTVISARTLEGLNMALVEFDSVESAIRTLDALQGKEVSMIGAPSVVSFAKVLPMHQQPPQLVLPTGAGVNGPDAMPQPLLQEQLFNGAMAFQQQGNVSLPVFTQQQQHQHQQQSAQQQAQQPHQQQLHVSQNYNHSFVHVSPNEKEQCPFPLPPPSVVDQVEVLKKIIDSFDTDHDPVQTRHILNNALNYQGTSETSDFGPLPDPLSIRDFDAPKLRELRKNIDANLMSDLEIEQLAMAMLDELPELCSDYLGNTIVQKLFTHSSDIIKDIMLRKTNKYLTSMGVHKNGTWACQKIIRMACTPRQIMLVTKGVEKYCTPLFNDQFGNYVIQCVLRFGFPWNGFIFESIIANFWTITQNRYGARAVRACLETHDIVTPEQTLVISSMIVLYSEYLATNSNGTLLLNWFLDTCTLPHRHSILAPNLVTHIVELCRHRLASLTVLKVLNYRGDEGARRDILEAIFGNFHSDDVVQSLHQILCDTNYGPTFIYKVLTMSLLEGDVRAHVVKQVRKVLLETTPSQQHRRLLEEVGLAASSSQSQSGQGKHRSSLPQVFSQDGTHLRGLSVSSVRSNGSRQNALVPTTSAGQSSVQTSANTATTGNNVSWTPSATGYMNFPGMFPVSYNNGNGAYPVNNDELATQFDMLSLNNNTHLSLPQLSLSNQGNHPVNAISPNKNNPTHDVNLNSGMYGY